MELRKFLSSTTELSNCEGPQDHVVLSSRVRLARNVTGRPFPGRAKKASRVETCEFIQPAIAAASAMRDTRSWTSVVPSGPVTAPISRSSVRTSPEKPSCPRRMSESQVFEKVAGWLASTEG